MDYNINWSRMLTILLQIAAIQWSVRAGECDADDHDIIRARASSLYDKILLNDLEGYGFNGALLSDRAAALRICRDYRNFKESIVNLLPKCVDDSIVRSLRVFLGYICYEGENAFFEHYSCIKTSFSNTQMLSCSGLPTKYQDEIKSRYTSATDRMKANCKVARYTASCLASNATVLCKSPAAGEVIFNVMKHSTENQYANEVVSCHVTERDLSKLSLDLSNVDDVESSYGTTLRNPLSMEQQVPTCAYEQPAATTFKLSEATRCISPLEHFVKSRWNFIDSSQAVISRKDQTNLCRAYADFKICITNSRRNCDLIESHLAGLTEAFDNFCNTDYEYIRSFNGCSSSSRRATTRCLQPFMTYKAAPNIPVYENVSRLCKTLVESVDCVVDRTQIFIETCSHGASKFGVDFLMTYMATLNISVQVTYYTVLKGVCPAKLPTWHVSQQTGKLVPSTNYYFSDNGGNGRNGASQVTSLFCVLFVTIHAVFAVAKPVMTYLRT